MYPEDIAALFNLVEKKTPVRIINEPYKVGWNQNSLYLEIHKALPDVKVTNGINQTPAAVANPLGMDPTKNSTAADASNSSNDVKGNPFAGLSVAIQHAIQGKQASVNDNLAQKIIDEQNGIPQVIGASSLAMQSDVSNKSVEDTATVSNKNVASPVQATKENITKNISTLAPVQSADEAKVTISQGKGKF
jgi:hypothetical protein